MSFLELQVPSVMLRTQRGDTHLQHKPVSESLRAGDKTEQTELLWDAFSVVQVQKDQVVNYFPGYPAQAEDWRAASQVNISWDNSLPKPFSL